MSKKNERQNRVAGELLEFLVSRTRLEFPRLEAEIVGNSVVVRSENRNCSVGFILPDHGSASRLIKFAVSLHENSTKISDGRTENPEDVLACATSWIGERLSLEDLYTRFEFIDKKRRALRLLAKHINEAQTDAGSEVLTTLENSNNYDFGAQLWIYSDRRSCHLKPVEGSKNIKCYFLSDGTVLASAELGDKDAAAEGVNLWLDQSLALDELSRDIANLEPTDFAAMFESGDVRQWSWSKLMKEFAEDNFYEDYLPILEALIEIPEVNRFFPYTDRGDIRFSRCSHEPFTYAGMPVINRRPTGFVARCNDEEIEGDIEGIVSFITQCLARISDSPFVGCADDVLLHPVNNCLAEQGSALRVKRIWRGRWSKISVCRGERNCDLQINEPLEARYSVFFRTGKQRHAFGWYKTLTGVAGALHMWLEQGCKLEDLAAVADKFHVPSRRPPDISAKNS